MSEKELSKYYWLKQEIENLDMRIKEFDVGISSVNLDKLNVDGTAQYKSIQEKRMELIEKFMNKRLEALEEYLKIESYIDSINDSEIRQLLRFRFLDLKKWDDIDILMNNGTEYSKKKYYKWKKLNISLFIPH